MSQWRDDLSDPRFYILPSELDALAAEAEQGYWCREPIGNGRTCNELGRPVDLPVGLHRPVLCEQHRQGWGRKL